MERRTFVDGEAAERDEEHQHDDARREHVGRKASPPWIGSHATGEDQEPRAAAQENEDGGDHV